MGIEFHFDGGASEERWSGEVDAEEILAFIEEFSARPEFRPGLKRLIHLGDATFDVSYPEIEQFVERLRADPGLLERQRWALVARIPVHFGLGRMFQSLADELPMEVRVFQDETEARVWLWADSSSQ